MTLTRSASLVLLSSLIGCGEVDRAATEQAGDRSGEDHADARPRPVRICHVDASTGEWQLIRIPPALRGFHMRFHGDQLPGQWYIDADGDGFGDPEDVPSPCPAANRVDNADDCDDGDANTWPGAEELCWDGRDNDCNDEVDEVCTVCPCYQAEELVEWYVDSFERAIYTDPAADDHCVTFDYSDPEGGECPYSYEHEICQYNDQPYLYMDLEEYTEDGRRHVSSSASAYWLFVTFDLTEEYECEAMEPSYTTYEVRQCAQWYSWYESWSYPTGETVFLAEYYDLTEAEYADCADQLEAASLAISAL